MAARAGRHTLGQQDAPPAPTRAARAQQPPRHHSTAHSRSRHSISSWPQLIFRRQPLYRRASGPGARCSTGRARPGPRRRGPASGLRESPPHRSLAGLEAGSSRDSWCAGCRPLPSPHSPLGTRGSWEPGADPSDVENNYGKTAATHAGGAGRPSGRSPWLPARCPHAASRPLAVPTVPAQAHIPPRSWLAGAQPVFYKYLAGPTLWPRVLCTARGLSQPETLVLETVKRSLIRGEPVVSPGGSRTRQPRGGVGGTEEPHAAQGQALSPRAPGPVADSPPLPPRPSQ